MEQVLPTRLSSYPILQSSTPSKSIINTVPCPFKFDEPIATKPGKNGKTQDVSITLKNVRGKIPSLQASRLRTMMLEAHRDPSKILAHCCSYDGLSSRLCEEAGFPLIFLAGYAVASAYGLPDTGYIALQEVCDKIQEAVRQTSIPVMADGDTGYGSPMNVKRTVESFAEAGAAGIMIEDQTWSKRCGHTKGKSVVSRGEAYARIQAACDAGDEGKDIFVLARTDSLILGWEEAMARAKEFKRSGVDAVFVEALPDRESMTKCVKELDIPTFANTKLESIRETLEALKKSMTEGTPPMILSYSEVCEGVGFNKYWDLEDKYKFDKPNGVWMREGEGATRGQLAGRTKDMIVFP